MSFVHFVSCILFLYQIQRRNDYYWHVIIINDNWKKITMSILDFTQLILFNFGYLTLHYFNTNFPQTRAMAITNNYPVKNVTWMLMEIPCHFIAQIDGSLSSKSTPNSMTFPCHFSRFYLLFMLEHDMDFGQVPVM